MLACSALLLLLVAAVRWSASLRDLDARGFDALSGGIGDNGAVRVVAGVADPLPFALIGAALVCLAALRGLPRVAVAIAALLASAALTTEMLKRVLEQGTLHGGAFPSGHTTAACALAAGLAIALPRRARPAALGAGAVGVATVLLGWHTPSDVAGGVLVAGTATATVMTVLARLPAAAPRAPAAEGRPRAVPPVR